MLGSLLWRMKCMPKSHLFRWYIFWRHIVQLSLIYKRSLVPSIRTFLNVASTYSRFPITVGGPSVYRQWHHLSKASDVKETTLCSQKGTNALMGWQSNNFYRMVHRSLETLETVGQLCYELIVLSPYGAWAMPRMRLSPIQFMSKW